MLIEEARDPTLMFRSLFDADPHSTGTVLGSGTRADTARSSIRLHLLGLSSSYSASRVLEHVGLSRTLHLPEHDLTLLGIRHWQVCRGGYCGLWVHRV